MSYIKRVNSEGSSSTAILLKDLVCKTCINSTARVDTCIAYHVCKPTKVFDGGECNLYEKRPVK